MKSTQPNQRDVKKVYKMFAPCLCFMFYYIPSDSKILTIKKEPKIKKALKPKNSPPRPRFLQLCDGCQR